EQDEPGDPQRADREPVDGGRHPEHRGDQQRDQHAAHDRGRAERAPEQHPDQGQPQHGGQPADPGHGTSPSTAIRYGSRSSRSTPARSVMLASGPAKTAMPRLAAMSPAVAAYIGTDVRAVPTSTSSVGSASGTAGCGSPQNTWTHTRTSA